MYYYNKNMEVDFCVPKDGLLVQVSYRMTEDATRNREISALQKVGKFLNAKNAWLSHTTKKKRFPQ